MKKSQTPVSIIVLHSNESKALCDPVWSMELGYCDCGAKGSCVFVEDGESRCLCEYHERIKKLELSISGIILTSWDLLDSPRGEYFWSYTHLMAGKTVSKQVIQINPKSHSSHDKHFLSICTTDGERYQFSPQDLNVNVVGKKILRVVCHRLQKKIKLVFSDVALEIL